MDQHGILRSRTGPLFRYEDETKEREDAIPLYRTEHVRADPHHTISIQGEAVGSGSVCDKVVSVQPRRLFTLQQYGWLRVVGVVAPSRE